MTAKLIPLTEWPEHHRYPTVAGLRYLVFNAEKNGFASCIKRIGKRVLIDEAAYFAWVDAQTPATISKEASHDGR